MTTDQEALETFVGALIATVNGQDNTKMSVEAVVAGLFGVALMVAQASGLECSEFGDLVECVLEQAEEQLP